MEQLFLIAAAIATITITISKTLVFKPLRDNVPGKWLKKLLNCPYCLAHYFSFFIALYFYPFDFNLIIKTMALVTLSSGFAIIILFYLNLLEKK